MSSLQALPKPGELVGGKYRIVAPIGSGGMGVVFEAINISTERRVAVKWLNPELSTSLEAVERFKVEARATGRIHHPNVVAVHDIDEHHGHLYLIMELLTGMSLRKRISQGPIDAHEACQILFPVMRGMAAAHAVGVLHRDLKPDNIFLAESPDALEPVSKVLDFGIAKLFADSERTNAARTGVMGTYEYMAFEQLHGRKDLDERVDVYALAAVLYHMLTGRLPHDADNPVDLALRMLNTEPTPVSSLVPNADPELSAVINRALSRERDLRPRNVDELALALEPFSGGVRYRGKARDPRPSPLDASDASGPPSAKTVPPLPTPFVVETQSERATTQRDDRARNEANARPKRFMAVAAAVMAAASLTFLIVSNTQNRTEAKPAIAEDARAVQKPAVVSPAPQGPAKVEQPSDEQWEPPLAPPTTPHQAVQPPAVSPFPEAHAQARAEKAEQPAEDREADEKKPRSDRNKSGHEESRVDEEELPAPRVLPTSKSPTNQGDGFGFEDTTELPAPAWASGSPDTKARPSKRPAAK